MRETTRLRLDQAAAGTLDAEQLAFLITTFRWAFSKEQAVALLAEYPAAHKAVLAGLSDPQLAHIRPDIVTYVTLARMKQ